MSSHSGSSQIQKGLLLLLERTRDVYGYLPDHALASLAIELGVPLVDIYATATFYRALPLKPTGKHVVRICKSVPCYLKHNQPVIDAVQKDLGITPGQTTSDGLFSLELVNCIGACDKAPAMIIDGEVLGPLTPEKVAEILAGYRTGRG